MSEKVLGFKEKDADIILTGVGKEVWTQINIDENNFVPVVSLEWLERYCKRKEMQDFDVVELETGREGEIILYVNKEDLLSSARKEVETK